jgi:hypothetical protein
MAGRLRVEERADLLLVTLDRSLRKRRLVGRQLDVVARQLRVLGGLARRHLEAVQDAGDVLRQVHADAVVLDRVLGAEELIELGDLNLEVVLERVGERLERVAVGRGIEAYDVVHEHADAEVAAAGRVLGEDAGSDGRRSVAPRDEALARSLVPRTAGLAQAGVSLDLAGDDHEAGACGGLGHVAGRRLGEHAVLVQRRIQVRVTYVTHGEDLVDAEHRDVESLLVRLLP